MKLEELTFPTNQERKLGDTWSSHGYANKLITCRTAIRNRRKGQLVADLSFDNESRTVSWPETMFLQVPFPINLGHCSVISFLKKHNINTQDLSNYITDQSLIYISYLNVLSKYKLDHLIQHLSNSNLINPLQSAYTKRHSTECTLRADVDKWSQSIGLYTIDWSVAVEQTYA